MKILPLCRLLPLALLLLLNLERPTFGEQVFQFDGENRRTDFCNIHKAVENGNVSVKDALQGMNISASVLDKIEGVVPTISKRILDEAARRGGFNIDYVVMGFPRENETFTDMLMKGINHNDLACDWWERRVFRLDLGVVFVEEFYDADTIMVKKPASAEEKPFNFWAFTKPFSPGLWILILLIVIFTGIVYYALDFIKSRATRQETDTNFLGSVFFSFHAFTGHCNYSAKSRASQVLTTSMCFLYLILISAYTANLANFFIASNPPELVIENINDVIRYDLELCVLRGYPNTEILREKYPYANIVLRDDEEEMLIAVSDGECDVGLTALERWKTLSRDSRYNKDCDLEWIGRRVDTVPAGFALKDSPATCSSLLNNVLNYHLISMKSEGVVEEFWESYRESYASASCDTRSKTDQKNNRIQLNVVNMSGAFAFHLCFVAFAIALAIYEYYYQPKEIKKQIKNDFLSSFEDAMKSTGISMFDDNYSDGVEEASMSQSNLRRKSMKVVQDLSAKLDNEDMTNFSLQNQILLSHKVEYMTNLLQKNRAQATRKLEWIIKLVEKHYNQQKEEMKELREQVQEAQSNKTASNNLNGQPHQHPSPASSYKS